MNLMEKLAEEISRVTTIRSHYEELLSTPNVIVAPQIAMMTISLKKATAAIGSGEALDVIAALHDLADWTE